MRNTYSCLSAALKVTRAVTLACFIPVNHGENQEWDGHAPELKVGVPGPGGEGGAEARDPVVPSTPG